MRVEFDSERQSVNVDGVEISLVLLHALANPDASRFYKLVRTGNIVNVEAFELSSQEFQQRSMAN